MPFDGREMTPALRRAALIEALRAPALPPGVSWNFMTVKDDRGCGSLVCALGLAALMWPEHEDVLLGGYSSAREQAALFGIGQRAAEGVFWGQRGIYDNRRSASVTRRLVAAALERTEIAR